MSDRRAGEAGYGAGVVLAPIVDGPAFTEAADPDELHYRDHVEAYNPELDIPRHIDEEELPARLAFALDRAGVRPSGTIVELGAGVCWLSASLALLPAVERVIAVEFSRRRLELAPYAIGHLDAPAHKITRLHADMHAPGLPDGGADHVFTDASFHHSRRPDQLARTAYRLLRPGGTCMLFREPAAGTLRRAQPPPAVELAHGEFERVFRPAEYLRSLRDAGFTASRHPAAAGFTTAKHRALLRAPLSWLNGILYAEYTFLGVKPRCVQARARAEPPP